MKNLKNVSAILFFIALFVSSFQLIAQSDHVFKHDYTFTVPVTAVNNGAGEVVKGEITVFQINRPGQGNGLDYTLRVAGILNGAASNTIFQVRPITLNIKNPNPDNEQFSTTFVDRLQLVGGGTVIFMTVIFHLTSTGRNDPFEVLVEPTRD